MHSACAGEAYLFSGFKGETWGTRPQWLLVHSTTAFACRLFDNEVTIQSLLTPYTIKPLNLDCFTERTLVRDEKAWIEHEEDQVIAARMSAVHLDIIVKLL